MSDTPVAVVGAGPVGVTTALLLARLGIATVVLERHPAAYPLPRAVHLDDEVFRILAAAGVADGFAAISRPMPGMRLVDGRLRTMAEFVRSDTVGRYGYPQASMFDQPELEELLLRRAAEQPLIDIRRGCEVTGVSQGSVRYECDGVEHTLSATWIVGADGANSLVRQAIGSEFRDLGYEERWLVVDVLAAEPLDVWSGVQQVCDPRRAATFMHVVRDRYRWEFRLADGETVDGLAAQLETLIAPWTHGAPVELVRQAEYTFRARVADRWRSGRVLLAGDAAHQTPPFIGQGLGAGLRDAQDLAWKLAAVLGGADPALLDTYESERRPHVTKVVRAAITVGWALTGGQDAAAALRRVLLAAACRLPGFSKAAASSASPRLAAGPLVRRGRLQRLPGRLCPKPSAGFDDALGTGWSVISTVPVDTDLPAIVVAASDRVLAPWLGRSCAALLRPDRTVAATARRPSDLPAMLALVPRSGSRTRVPA